MNLFLLISAAKNLWISLEPHKLKLKKILISEIQNLHFTFF